MHYVKECFINMQYVKEDRLCGLVVRVSGYRYRRGSIPGATRFSE